MTNKDYSVFSTEIRDISALFCGKKVHLNKVHHISSVNRHTLYTPPFGPSDVIPTLCFQTFTEFRFGLPIWPQGSFWVKLVGHGGRGDHSLQAPLALGHVLLRVEKYHVDLGHVEHSQGDGCTEAHRDGQSCGLDVHL